ncbi:MAG: uroporphyrinogen decarboxylase family protein [Desulfitobacteriaceae bacterium]|nr:uroporphyrinogen decarboxylase family protein [Desulfitobacteriaceae bacterium]
MANKDVLIQALNYEEPARVPWVPYVGVHGGYLIGKDADEYLNSAELLYQGAMKAIEEYRPDGLPIAFDLQLEAEVLGCDLAWVKDNPPAVKGHVLDKVSLSDLRLPTEGDGRMPLVLKTAERLVQEVGKDIGLMGLVCGPFTLGLHLMGSKIVSKMVKKPDEVLEVMGFCAKVCAEMARMYLDRGIEIIAVVDPMTSTISPKFFDKFVVPSYDPAIEIINKFKAYSLCFVCGNATRIIPNLSRLNMHGFAVDENLDFKYVAEEARKNRKAFAGNLPLTTGLLFGEVEENIQYAEECIEIGKGPGFILAPGCDMPYFCEPENVKAVAGLVHGK